jgi:Colicin V production protein
MKVPTYLDAAVIGIPILLGVLGVRAGLRQSLVSWPVRWFVALVGAQVLLVLVSVYLIDNRDIAAEIRDTIQAIDPVVRRVMSVLLFVVALAVLLAFTRSLRRRVLDRIGDSFIGPMERTFGGFFGVGGGLLLIVWLIVIPYMLYETLQPGRGRYDAWIRGSYSLPYIKAAGENMRDALRRYAPGAAGRPQRAL